MYWHRMTRINFIYLGLLHWLNLNIFEHFKVTKVQICVMILFANPPSPSPYLGVAVLFLTS